MELKNKCYDLVSLVCEGFFLFDFICICKK